MSEDKTFFSSFIVTLDTSLLKLNPKPKVTELVNSDVEVASSKAVLI